jgi:membrane protease YdiL (CAAX protease family)
MTDDQPDSGAGLPACQPERVPFWGFSDLLLFIALGLPCMLGGGMLMKLILALFRWKPRAKAIELVPAEFLGYALLFIALYLMFRVQYDRPLFASLAWKPIGRGAGGVIGAGVLMALLVAMGGALLRVPDADTPLKKLLADPVSMWLLAAFGTTLGPVCEELIFRGFFQPLLVRVAGRVGGVMLAALPFGLLHLQQYGFSWRHALLVCCAGAGFGWMREATGSTRAASLMHAAYNGTFFIGLLAQRRELPHIW